ncbi:magnesium-translocating P-type ATPase [bacterium]|nr:MAG: magnesium-translocating P-type ATPase [bacterium]
MGPGHRHRRVGHVVVRARESLEGSASVEESIAVAPAPAGARSVGLSSGEALERLRRCGPNRVEGRGAGWAVILGGQFRNPLLVLLAGVAVLSIALGQHTDATIVLSIAALSTGLGFFNEYRATRVLDDLRLRIRRRAVVERDGHIREIDALELVPGDVMHLEVGDIVPADGRLIESNALECDESMLTGESEPVEKSAQRGDRVAMGTIVRAGTGVAEIIATGMRTAFGAVARAAAHALPETAFQRGLRGFSRLLLVITAWVTGSVFLLSVTLLRRSLWESLLFALAIAVSLAPQLLPAIVTISMALGARRMAGRGVVVKRLIAIEDLGNVQLLFTDKTGTLTEGTIAFEEAIDASGARSERAQLYGLLCNEALPTDHGAVGGNSLDRALWACASPLAERLGAYRRIGAVPFDFERRLMSVLVDGPDGRLLIAKGAPESILARCADVDEPLRRRVDELFDAGIRAVAVAQRGAPAAGVATPDDERDLAFVGLLLFRDPLKREVGASLERLRRLGIEVKILTGDNERVSRKICCDLGIDSKGVVTGYELDAMSDAEAIAAIARVTVFARVSPLQKSRIITLARLGERDVGFMGDGVNDAVALHDADVGISVDDATDVAKNAADIVLVTKDLGVLADGVEEGRRVFANTIKYVLMATSSNFGNMISTAIGSLVLPFLPMLPSQLLLGNLLYDTSEMTIPTDRVDDELVQRPSHWDMPLIRRFMLAFGPVNALMDFSIFAFMALVLHVGAPTFRTAFFVESFATQTVVIFALRTRRSMWRSRPSAALSLTTLLCLAIGVALPFSPLASRLGFTALTAGPMIAIAALIVVYVLVVEAAKRWFFHRVIERP